MKRRAIPFLLAAALGAAACSDNQTAPQGAVATGGIGNSLSSCSVAQDSVDAILPQLFTPGSQRGLSASDDSKMNKALRTTDTATARQYMRDLIALATTSYYMIPSQIVGAPTNPDAKRRVEDLISGLLCLNGIADVNGNPITPTLPLDNANGGAGLVTPATGGLIQNGLKTAATYFKPGDVSGNTWVTINPISTTNPLDTPLPQYGAFFEFQAAPAGDFNNPVLTGVCTNLGPVDAATQDRLRLAHNRAPNQSIAPGNIRFGNIEILARAPDGADLGLSCTTLLSSASVLDKIINLLMPDPLYAGTGTGGSTGKVTGYSPFGSVDPGTLPYGTANWLFFAPSTGNATAPSAFTGLDGVTTPISGQIAQGVWKFGAAPFGDVRASASPTPGVSYATQCNGSNNTIDYSTVSIASAWQRAASGATGDLTYLFARRVFYASAAGSIDLPVDNDVQVWLDGVDVTSTIGTVTSGFLLKEGCATKGQVTLPNVAKGLHVLAVTARDRGTASFFDAQFNLPVPVN